LKKYLVVDVILNCQYHFKLFFIFIHIFSLLHINTIFATCIIKLHFPPSVINLSNLYLDFHLLHPNGLPSSFLPLSHVCNHEIFILQWEEENWHQMLHRTPWNVWLNTLISSIPNRICEMTKKPLEYPRDDT
jgi:hypothetical protein